MRSLLTLLSVTLLLPSALGTVVIKRAERHTGSYIVKLKDNGGVNAFSAASIVNPDSITTHYTDVLSGFAGKFSPEELTALQNNPNVEEIYEDGEVHAFGAVTQLDAPWGLNRISHTSPVTPKNPALLTFNYTRDETDGAGVDVYIIDTGIRIDHVQFGGRAEHGFTAFDGDHNDGSGHGTHVAGTVGGIQFGVAKKVHLIAVKVLNADGRGRNEGVLAGLDWVIQEAKKRGHPSVINMSLGGGANDVVDGGVRTAITNGIHAVVAAGNENQPAKNVSPARVLEAITVGAIDINDAKASFSNYGPEVDVHAPGVDIRSAWIGSTTDTASISGTSMASPHVAGLVAYYIGLHGNKSPQEMSEFIKSTALSIATGFSADTTNKVAYNSIESTKLRRHALPRNESRATWSRRARFAKRSHA